MPQVNVRFFAAARAALGVNERLHEVTNLTDLLSQLESGASPDARTVLSRSSFLVNSVARTDLEQSLESGDTVDVLPPFAGG